MGTAELWSVIAVFLAFLAILFTILLVTVNLQTKVTRSDLTKDVGEKVDELKTSVTDLATKLNTLDTGLTSKIDTLDSGLTNKIDSLRTDIAGDMAELRADVVTEVRRLDNRIDGLDVKIDGLGKELRNELRFTNLRLDSMESALRPIAETLVVQSLNSFSRQPALAAA